MNSNNCKLQYLFKGCFSSLGAEITAQVTEDGDVHVDGVAEQIGDIKIKEQDGRSRSVIFKSVFLNFYSICFVIADLQKSFPFGTQNDRIRLTIFF